MKCRRNQLGLRKPRHWLEWLPEPLYTRPRHYCTPTVCHRRTQLAHHHYSSAPPVRLFAYRWQDSTCSLPSRCTNKQPWSQGCTKAPLPHLRYRWSRHYSLRGWCRSSNGHLVLSMASFPSRVLPCNLSGLSLLLPPRTRSPPGRLCESGCHSKGFEHALCKWLR